MKIRNTTKGTFAAFKIKSHVKAGADPRGYCLQSCVTRENQCRTSGRSGCDQVRNQCIADCTGIPTTMWLKSPTEVTV